MLKIKDISVYVFCLFVFSLSRQVPFSIFPFILQFSFLLFIVVLFLTRSFFSVNANRVMLFYLVFCLFLFMYGICRGNSPELVFRFFLVLFFLGFVFLFNYDNRKYAVCFRSVYYFQAVVVIFLGVSLPVFFDDKSYIPVRMFFLSMMWGDVYTYSGFFYRIQILGNALLPVLFFMVYDRFRNNKCGFFVVVLCFLGVVFAGNFAFYLASLFFVVIYEVLAGGFRIKRPFIASRFKFFFFCIFILLLPIISSYFHDIFILKSNGESSSLGARYEQVYLLWVDLNESFYSLLFGRGLGHTLDVVSSIRDYRGAVYFEVQLMYMLNQLGVLFFIVFFIFHLLFLFLSVKDRVIALMYFSYFIYAVTNPYIFDTNHLAVLIALLSYQHERLTSAV